MNLTDEVLAQNAPAKQEEDDSAWYEDAEQTPPPEGESFGVLPLR